MSNKGKKKLSYVGSLVTKLVSTSDIEIAIFEKSLWLSFFDGLVLFNFYFISDRWGPEIDHDLREVLPSVPKRILE